MNTLIFHIDVNSAFLSWSSVENIKTGKGPDLREIPSIIGGDQNSRHGVVLAKSVAAKKYGIVTGEPVAQAFKKCPDLVTALPDHGCYKRYSRQLMHLLSSYSDKMEQLSIDECFLDMSHLLETQEDYYELARTIKDTVFEQLGFTVNIGISDKKVLAKMASDFEKPNRVHTLFLKEIKEKMWPLPVRELYMAGGSSEEILNKLGIYRIGDLARSDKSYIISHLKKHGALLWEFANGIDDRPVYTKQQEVKGIGNSVTLPSDVTTAKEAKQIIEQLAQKVSCRLKKEKKLAGTITLEIRYHTFQNVSHQKQILTPTSSEKEIYQNGCELFDTLWNKEAIRLLGIRGTKLSDENEPVQMNLFDMDYRSYKLEAKQKKLQEALKGIRDKYGKEVVKSGSELFHENKDT